MLFKSITSFAIAALCFSLSQGSPVENAPLEERQCSWGQGCSGGP